MKPLNDKTNLLNLKGGVLIIGSLLWQDYLTIQGDDIRKTWRAERLLVDNKIMVRVPIRYGRFSKKNDLFTMTFAKSVSKRKFGTGYFVPFSKPNITTTDELFNEATALSTAEGMNGQFHANWGATLGLLFNDKRVDKKIQKSLTAEWQAKILSTNFNNQSYKLENEQPCIKANGLLNFAWTLPVDQRQIELLNSYDFILATVTQPTEYPLLKDLSKNVRSDKTRFYFVENYKNGITTFQDISILNLL